MPPAHALLAFCLASIVLIEIPGPSLLFALGRALTVGRREALLSVVGNAGGLLVQVAAVAIGLGAVVAASATAFTALKLAGGLYVAYLGVQAIRHRHEARSALDAGAAEPLSGPRALATGLMVGMTNPKTVVFFVAFLPQFVQRSHAAAPQLLLLGLIFAVLAVGSDACWVLAASRAKAWFAREPKRLDRLGATGGVMMIGLGGVLLTAGNGG
jgi:threonine/homoserine/homoserine lactone efflux protein